MAIQIQDFLLVSSYPVLTSVVCCGRLIRSKGTSNDSSEEETQYPHIYLVFNHIRKTTEDIWALTVCTRNRSWTNRKNFGGRPYLGHVVHNL